MTLSGLNTYSGGTGVADATLVVASDRNLGAATGELALFDATLEITAAGFTSARDVTLYEADVIKVDAGTASFSGVIGDGSAQKIAGGLTKTGAGTLALSGANTYTGGTRIYAGTVSISDGSGGNYAELGSGAVTLSNGALELTSDGVALANKITVAAGKRGTIGVAAGKSSFLNQTGSTPLNVGAGATLVFGSATDTGTVDFQTYGTASASANVVIAGGTVDDIYSYLAEDYLSVVSKTTLYANTTLIFDTTNAEIKNLVGYASSATIDIGTGGNQPTLILGAGTYAGAIAGSGGLQVAGSVTLSGFSSYTGGTTINAGAALKVGKGGSTSAASAIVDDGTIKLAGGTLAGASLVEGSGASGLVTGTGTVSANVSSALDFTSSGGALTFTGTDVFGGKLSGSEAIFGAGKDTFAAGSSISVSTFDIAGAAVSLGANVTYRGSFDLASGSLNVSASNLNTYGALDLAGGTITGSGRVASYGTATLEGHATSSGSVTLIAGGLLTATGSLSLTGDSDLLVSRNGTYDLAGNGYIGARTAGDTITNQGLIEKTAGRGTSLVTAAITNTGTITAGKGTLDLTGAIGGTGALSIEGNSAMELGAIIAAGQKLTFGTGNGILKLDDAPDFHASISGFGQGDSISLKGFDQNAHLLYEAATKGTGGTLTVTDGSKQFSTHLNDAHNASGFSLTHTSIGETIHYTPPKA